MYTGIVYLLKCEPSQCISVVILTMLIIVTVSSQDTAFIYIYKAYTQCIVVTAVKD